MLASLIANLASGEAAVALRRARYATIAYILAAVFGMLGLAFLISAGFVWTARRFGHIEAALGFGVGFLAVAGLVLVTHKFAARSRAREHKRKRSSDMAAMGVATALAVLPTLLRSKGGLAAVLGPVLAIAAYAIYRENVPPGEDDEDSSAT